MVFKVVFFFSLLFRYTWIIGNNLSTEPAQLANETIINYDALIR